jgi:hypothetical protein
MKAGGVDGSCGHGGFLVYGRLSQRPPPLVGERCAGRQPVDEAKPEFLLQRLNVRGHGRLGKAQFGGGCGEAAGSCQRDEGGEYSGVHGVDGIDFSD